MNVSNQSKKEKVTTSNENEKYSKTKQKKTENVERIEIMTVSIKSEKEKVTNSSEKRIIKKINVEIRTIKYKCGRTEQNQPQRLEKMKIM